MKKRAFDELMSFPCVHAFKAVGLAGGGLADHLREAVATVLGRDVPSSQISVRDSKAGKYRSVTLEIPVENSDEVYAVYAALSENDAVRYVL